MIECYECDSKQIIQIYYYITILYLNVYFSRRRVEKSYMKYDFVIIFI